MILGNLLNQDKNIFMKAIKSLLTFFICTILICCSKNENKNTRILPTQIELVFPEASSSYQTLDITYNSQFQIESVTRNRANSSVVYTCSYDNNLLTNLKIEESLFAEERNYQIQYTNGILSKITESILESNTEFEIDHNNITNIYKYNFPYTWKFDMDNDLEYYFFSSTRGLEVIYEEGNAFNYFMNPQPVLAILDTYFAENFYQDLFFLSQKPIIKTRYEDFISSDVIVQNFTNFYDTNNRLIKSEIRYDSDTIPSIIKTITYSKVSF